jgi:ribonuclease HI
VIEIYVDGRSLGSKGAGFAVGLIYEEFRWIRSILCPGFTSNQAELAGVEFALKSISEAYKEDEISIRTSSRYVPLMLERVGEIWTKTAAVNIEKVDALRELYLKYPLAHIFSDPEDEMMLRIQKVNENVIKKNTTIFER